MRLSAPIVCVLTGLLGCGRIGFDEIGGRLGHGSDSSSQSGGASFDAGSGGGAQSVASGGGSALEGGIPPGDSGADARPREGGMGATDATGGAGGASGGDGAVDSGRAGSATGGSATDGSGTGLTGCADGEREGFVDPVTYPDIAACAGGFALPGTVGLSAPSCGRTAGDDGALPDGTGCSALDLCAAGFHVCSSAVEVDAKSPTGCAGSTAGPELAFFVTAQSGNGQGKCDPTGTDDVFGCGSLGARPNVVCAPLDRWSGNVCSALTMPWSCGTDQRDEASHLVKPGSAGGGVLCCRD